MEAFAFVVLFMTYTVFEVHVVIVLGVTDVMGHIIAIFSSGLFWFLFVLVFFVIVSDLNFLL